MKKDIFSFKRFDCFHHRSSMKIGVDAVLIGAWADIRDARRILDVGTGCGVIALMCAQRNPDAIIRGIDTDEKSVGEASLNFRNSEWGDRLSADLCDFNSLEHLQFDHIISNPPYFKSGIDNPVTARESARHEASLSPVSILAGGARMLSENGHVSMVFPFLRREEIYGAARSLGYSTVRELLVKGNPNAEYKRVLADFALRQDSPLHSETLVIEEAPGVYTQEYKDLCRDFYLKF